MIYGRINLNKTKYNKTEFKFSNLSWKYIPHPDPIIFNNIYKTYCEHKNFKSVVPIFDSEYTRQGNEVIGYYNNKKLIGFSLITIYDDENAEAIQFAWDYKNPELKLGENSLKVECAILKERAYKYLYLGEHSDYKNNFSGYEIVGKL